MTRYQRVGLVFFLLGLSVLFHSPKIEFNYVLALICIGFGAILFILEDKVD